MWGQERSDACLRPDRAGMLKEETGMGMKKWEDIYSKMYMMEK